MSEGPWIRFFPSDWLAGTRGMSAAETGIYITLIAMMYEKGGPLQDDRKRLARLCGTTPAALGKAVETFIDQHKIVVVDGGLWNEKVGVETEFRREKSSSARDAADKRWGKGKQKQRRDDAHAKQSQSGGNANQSHNHIDASQAQHPADAEGRIDFNALEQGLRAAAGLETDPNPGLFDMSAIVGLLKTGVDWHLDVIPTIRAVSARATRKPRTWAYFTEAITEASAKRRAIEAKGLSPPDFEAAGETTIFEAMARQARNGQAEFSESDGPVVDVVPGLPGIH